MPSAPTTACPEQFRAGASSSDKDKVDYTAVVDYNWTDDLSTYAKVATGFRSGGSSRNGLDFNQAFDQETVLSYELGWKSQLMDNHLRLNAAAFYMEVDDIILDYLPDPVNNPQFVEVFNSRRRGYLRCEVDLGGGAHGTLLVSFNYAYLDYDINDAIFPTAPTGPAPPCWCGRRRALFGERRLQPADRGWRGQLHLDYSWQDSQYALANTDAGKVEVSSFGLLNGRISLADVNMFGGNWQFALWGKNLANRTTATT